MATVVGGQGRVRSPAFAGLMEVTESLLPLIEAEADEAEKLFHQSDKVAAALREAGLYSMVLPKALGGAELPLVEAMQIIEKMSWADGSAGWCAMAVGVSAASVGAYVPEEGAQVIWGEDPLAMAAGNGVPRGYARRVDGGYMIRGSWAYGSGLWHADWGHSGCFLMEGDKMVMSPDGGPEIILMHHPKSGIVFKNNWNVLGLRGTGSYDYTLTEPESFVPEHMAYRFDAREPLRGGRQYAMGLVGFTAWGHTGWALGVGRRALDELAKLARERADVFGKLCDSATFKKSFAEAEAKYRSARAFVYEGWNSIADRVAADGDPTVEQIALIRLAMRHLHDVLSEVTTFAHKASRGVSLRSSVLQRCYRDAHSGTQHLLLADEIETECGLVLLGNTGPDAYWTMFGVKG
jgi:alkylation response protein AidB-like acyl-CoA dehydrogenase